MSDDVPVVLSALALRVRTAAAAEEFGKVVGPDTYAAVC